MQNCTCLAIGLKCYYVAKPEFVVILISISRSASVQLDKAFQYILTHLIPVCKSHLYTPLLPIIQFATCWEACKLKTAIVKAVWFTYGNLFLSAKLRQQNKDIVLNLFTFLKPTGHQLAPSQAVRRWPSASVCLPRAETSPDLQYVGIDSLCVCVCERESFRHA